MGLVTELNNGTVTSEQLIAIYGERAATYGRKTCIITEDYFEYALKKAKECDQERRSSKKCNWTFDDEWDMNRFFPPLFGIPISVKENIDMAGTRSTLGATIRADKFQTEDCATIKNFKLSGMIPFIKTNLPQLAFTYDSVNHLWGRTLNPWNHKKSAGGSSGGEGAAIAARVSPVGIGNDMAGSIRIPAAFNGVFGICPSADRLPFNGQIWYCSPYEANTAQDSLDLTPLCAAMVLFHSPSTVLPSGCET